eukprot:7251697-Lingulodinium_polyedra.AAC.1
MGPRTEGACGPTPTCVLRPLGLHCQAHHGHFERQLAGCHLCCPCGWQAPQGSSGQSQDCQG